MPVLDCAIYVIVGLRTNTKLIDELLLEYFISSLLSSDSQMKKEMLWKRQKASSPQDLQLSRSVENYMR